MPKASTRATGWAGFEHYTSERYPDGKNCLAWFLFGEDKVLSCKNPFDEEGLAAISGDPAFDGYSMELNANTIYFDSGIVRSDELTICTIQEIPNSGIYWGNYPVGGSIPTESEYMFRATGALSAVVNNGTRATLTSVDYTGFRFTGMSFDGSTVVPHISKLNVISSGAGLYVDADNINTETIKLAGRSGSPATKYSWLGIWKKAQTPAFVRDKIAVQAIAEVVARGATMG